MKNRMVVDENTGKKHPTMRVNRTGGSHIDSREDKTMFLRLLVQLLSCLQEDVGVNRT